MAAHPMLTNQTRGALSRLLLVLGLATGMAAVSASLSTEARADSLTLGFGFGNDGVTTDFGSTIGDDDNDDGFEPAYHRRRHYEPAFDDEQPRWRHRRHRSRVVCRIVPVRVFDGFDYVIEERQRCRRIRRW
jgi:hypothetical protein